MCDLGHALAFKGFLSVSKSANHCVARSRTVTQYKRCSSSKLYIEL